MDSIATCNLGGPGSIPCIAYPLFPSSMEKFKFSRGRQNKEQCFKYFGNPNGVLFKKKSLANKQDSKNWDPWRREKNDRIDIYKSTHIGLKMVSRKKRIDTKWWELWNLSKRLGRIPHSIKEIPNCLE